MYERPTLRLTFTDPEMDGLQVRARRLSLGELHRLDILAAGGWPVEESDEHLAELYALLAAKLIDWNLAEDGTPVDLNADTLAAQDLRFVRGIRNALVKATTEVAAPLGVGSSSGDPSLEVSIPMDELSPSPPNSNGPSGS